MSADTKLIVVGASWGGLHAMQTILHGLPGDYPFPIAFVQHRGKETYDTLAAVLQAKSALPVVEADDKILLSAPGVYVAPSDYHMLVDGGCAALSTEEPVGFSRPSIDVLFKSAADSLGEKVIGVLLTGANRDGSEGLAHIQECGGLTIVQDPETAESRAMPESGIARVPEARVVALEEMAPLFLRLASTTGQSDRPRPARARDLASAPEVRSGRSGGSSR